MFFPLQMSASNEQRSFTRARESARELENDEREREFERQYFRGARARAEQIFIN